jgi:hypothetical protein
MKQYISNILPRLQQFSKSLDHLENFVDKPWVLIDDDLNRHVYIFKRDKSLIISVNGSAEIGRWDYIQAADSILVDAGTSKTLLRHAFVEKGLMILKIDGLTEQPWVLANEKEIPDLDVDRYMKDLLAQKLKLKLYNFQGRNYYISDPYGQGITSNTRFFDEQFRLVEESFTLTSEGRTYSVKNGIVRASYFIAVFKSDKGELEIRSQQSYITKDDEVFINGSHAPDAMYKIVEKRSIDSITVRDGKIVKMTFPTSYLGIGIAAAVVVCLGLIVYAMFAKASAQPDKKEQVTTDVEKADTANRMMTADSSTNIVLASVSYNSSECKARITGFLDAINNRSFSLLKDYFPEVIDKYYNDRNVFSSDEINSIRQYWTETIGKGYIAYDTTEMISGKQDGDYYVEAKQFQAATDKEDRIPVISISSVRYVLSASDLKIKSVTGNLITKEYDYLTLFNVPFDDKRDIESFISTANTVDFDRIFNRLSSSDETYRYKQVLNEAILNKFGANTPVYGVNSKSDEFVILEDFCRGLTDGTIHFISTKNVYRSSDDQLTKLEVASY